MQQHEYDVMARAERDHWWYANTRLILRESLADRRDRHGSTHVLDVGCGTGSAGGWLSELGHVIGLDMSNAALAHYRSSHDGVPICGAIPQLPFANDSFDVVVCVTVLYHSWVGSPNEAVAEFARVLKPDGVVVLLEPGITWLRRAHDQQVMTGRRFSRRSLTTLFSGSGLHVQRVSGAYTFLAPPAAALSLLHRIRQRNSSDLSHHQSGGGGLALKIGALERYVLRRWNLPTGLSVFAVATKRAEQNLALARDNG